VVVAAIRTPVDPTDALLAGLAAGFAIAMQVGAVSLLLIEAAVASGPRVGAAAGMGVATADLAFAAIAAAAGGAAGAALQGHEGEIRFVAAGVIAGIAAHGLARLRREGTADAGAGPDRAAGGARTDRPVDGASGAGPERPGGWAAGSHYLRFLAITAANPLTIASFAAVAVALSLEGVAATLAFTAGVGMASFGWHLFLGAAAGHAGRWMTARVRRGLAIGGRLAVLAIAVHLALGV
jgi:threonine/homoserine/homoserine lactone efflux protein